MGYSSELYTEVRNNTYQEKLFCENTNTFVLEAAVMLVAKQT